MATSCSRCGSSISVGGTYDARGPFSDIWCLRANVYQGSCELWKIPPGLHLSTDCLRLEFLRAFQRLQSLHKHHMVSFHIHLYIYLDRIDP